MATPNRVHTIHREALSDGVPISRHEQEQLMKPYLPTPRNIQLSARSSPYAQFDIPNIETRKHEGDTKTRSTSWFSLIIHRLIFHSVQLVLSLYIYARQRFHMIYSTICSSLYHHDKNLELIRRDIRSLDRAPKHLSVVVDVDAQQTKAAIKTFVAEVAELACWSICAGVGVLSVYEISGILKSQMVELYEEILQKLRRYYGDKKWPEIRVRTTDQISSSSATNQYPKAVPTTQSRNNSVTCFEILLLSSHDGRDTLVDLTKTIADMSQRSKISPTDITTELIHAEIQASSGFSEPDLLLVLTSSKSQAARRKGDSSNRGFGTSTMSMVRQHMEWGGDGICLHGYPPWQVRLTEIFHGKHAAGVDYQAFLRALHRYAKAEMRFGR